MHIYYEVTNKCNIKCPYCYSESNEIDYTEIEMDVFCECIDRMTRFMGLKSITFSGGEPLIKQEILDMMSFCKSKGLTVYLITNGTLMEEHHCNVLKSLDKIIVSLHENYREKISLKILQNIKLGNNLQMSVVLNKRNFCAMDEYFEFAELLQTEIIFKLQKFQGRGKNKDCLEKKDIIFINNKIADYNLHKKGNVPPVLTITNALCCCFSDDYEVYTMLPNGDLYLCSVLPRKYKIGNVVDHNWRCNIKSAVGKLHDDWSEYKANVCVSCIIKKKCHGICMSEVVSLTDKCVQCELKCDAFLRELFIQYKG